MNIQDNIQPENSSTRKQTYTAQEISLILGVSVRTAYNFCEKQLCGGKTREFKVIRVGKCVRVNKESFDRWFNACREAEE